MTTSDLATLLQVHPQTIRRWTNQGQLDCTRTLGNHRRFQSPATGDDSRLVIGYARISSHDQKADLVRQRETLETARPLDDVILDTGSGMNYKKPGFRKLMLLILQGRVKELVLTHKDRLLRFGSEIIFRVCRFFQVKVTILAAETETPKDSKERFCSRIYGERSHANRKRRAATAAAGPVPSDKDPVNTGQTNKCSTLIKN